MFFQVIKLLFNKFIRRKKTGVVIKEFSEKMGVVYIKLAQILATQNFGNLFTEEDRILISGICDDINIINFEEIKKVIENEYGKRIEDIFISIDETPVGAASISQVHHAVLKTGEEVAVKVKRKDVTDTMEHDIKFIKNVIHRFGKIVKFKNIKGGDKALEMYLSWIREEIDFENEKNNIIRYGEFASSVNGKVENTKNIKVPKVYEELCTSNIIVMEFIHDKTINKLDLSKNNLKIREGINSYLKSSFHALFHDKTIIFHGDPHGGNVYLDKEGNIGFLDMGLIFELSVEDAKMTRNFFLCAYTGNYNKMYEMLVPYAFMNSNELESFKEEIKEYISTIKQRKLTSYFTDMINICLSYNIVPPEFLFCMAKAFICLDGICVFSNNTVKATELLQEQTIEYFINRSIDDCKNLMGSGLSLGPKLIQNTVKYGIVKGVSKEIMEVMRIRSDLKEVLDHCDEIINVLNE